MKSNRALKRWYNKINANFFNGELPPNVCVRWSEPDDIGSGDEYSLAPDDIASTDYGDGRHKYEIILSREFNPHLTVELNSLLHEMVHIATNMRDDHGAVFEQWRKTLGDRGIFKKGALRKGITLF